MSTVIIEKLNSVCTPQSNDGPCCRWTIERSDFSSFAAMTRFKQQLLKELLKQFPLAILDYSENPVDDGVSGDWVQGSHPQHWVIPGNVDAGEVLQWLYLGGWTIDFLTQNRDGEDDYLNGQGSEICLESFHDNDPWFVSVARQ
jgi:hypothetical protein